jgi:uncharacterized damage-inducible protein DinB
MEFLNQVLLNQFEAALCMLDRCLRNCPPEHWDGRIANNTFRQVAYHTLFFVEAYLGPSPEAFQLRDVHQRGGDERLPVTSPGLSKEETLSYLAWCRQKLVATLGTESAAALQGPSGFPGRPASRAELHIYNLRHVQHHTGQLSAYLRKLDGVVQDDAAIAWVGSGWK